MEKSQISSWVRQARYRANKHKSHNDLSICDIEKAISSYDFCAYCGINQIETLDHAFSLKDDAPNIAANVLPSCKSCKKIKKNNNIIWMFNNKHLKSNYINILALMFQFDNDGLLKSHVKKMTGLINNEELKNNPTNID